MANAVLFVALQAIIMQTVYCQCVNRVVSGCGPNVVEAILPNQFFGPQGILAPLPSFAPAPVLAPTPILPSLIPEVGYPTMIQDSSVANSLANALQLLVVSNLLSSTLPGPCGCELPIPGYPVESLVPMQSLPAYNYLY